jgi:hypothetical protein
MAISCQELGLKVTHRSGSASDNRGTSMSFRMPLSKNERCMLTCEKVLEYQTELREAAPGVHFLMSLFVSFIQVLKELDVNVF